MFLSTAAQAVALGALSFAVVVNGQQPGLSSLPSCVMECVIPLAPKAGCGNTDFQCFCTHQEFVDSFTTCMPKRCPSQSDLQTILSFGNVMCEGKEGFPLTEKDLGITASSSGSHAGHTASQAASSATGMPKSAAMGMRGERSDVMKAAVAAAAAVIGLVVIAGGAGI